LHAVAAVGHIPQVIGYSQCDSLRLSELGKITGRISISAINNIPSVTGERYVGQLRWAQLGSVT
jgi:hypothetical protein